MPREIWETGSATASHAGKPTERIVCIHVSQQIVRVLPAHMESPGDDAAPWAHSRAGGGTNIGVTTAVSRPG